MAARHASSTNGAARVAVERDQSIAGLREILRGERLRRDELRAELEALRAELAEVTAGINVCERALAALAGEASAPAASQRA